MAVLVERERQTPVVREVDVLVVGGGTSGVPAAIAAARMGSNTLLIEKFNSFGGAITWGLTITLPPYPIVGPILNEILRRLRQRYGAVAQRTSEPPFVVFDQELFKYEALLMLEEAGVEMLLNTYAVDAWLEGSRVAGVIVENKSGRQAVRAKVTIDCTGDADIAFRAGAPVVKAPREQLLPITLMWVAANVDTAAPEAAKGLNCMTTEVHDGELNVWGGRADGVDATDAWALTRAEVELRKTVIGDWLRQRANCEAWRRSYIGFTAPHLGVRETRRIVGEIVVTQEQLGKVDFHDSIGTAQFGGSFPYRALVPRERDGLLVAGRCVSTDPDVQHNIRIAPSCALFGQAAGTASALCVRHQVQPRQLPIEILQRELRTQRVHFGDLGELPKDLV